MVVVFLSVKEGKIKLGLHYEERNSNMSYEQNFKSNVETTSTNRHKFLL